MPEQPYGAPALPDDFDESEPGLPFRRPTTPDPRSSAVPLGRPGEFATDPAVAAAHADWMAATGPDRMIPDPDNVGQFIPAGQPAPPDEADPAAGLTVT